MSDDIRKRALTGLMWSLLQSWGAKSLSLILFLILAHLLTPAQLGVAAAITAVTTFVGLIAEQGFGDAIVQRRDLRPEDVNLPFYTSLSVSSLLALVLVVLSSRIERWMNVPGLAPLLAAASVTLPLTALSMFQEVMYRRQLIFKLLAVRMLAIVAISGVIGVLCALCGLGSWSLVVQAISMGALNVAWLWRKPLWRPSRKLNVPAFRDITKFSSSVLAYRLFDFASTRVIEILIVTLHGAAALGMYSVGAKVYQTLMLLLSSAIMDVSLSAFSRIAHDPQRLRGAYLRSFTTSAATAMPTFIAVAAVASELALAVFGKKWLGSGAIMNVLMLLGALQCVQFMNGSVFNAIGRPGYIAWLTLSKAVTTLAAMWLVPTQNVVQLAVVFAVSQLIATPITFALVCRALELPFLQLIRQLYPFALAAALAYLAVSLMRPFAHRLSELSLIQLVVLAGVFAVVYLPIVFVFGQRHVKEVASVFTRPSAAKS